MAVVAIELDGTSCAGRSISVAGIGDSSPVADTAFQVHEELSVRLEQDGAYVAFLPAFFYRLGGIEMRFSGVEMPTSDLSCVKSVGAVAEFKKDDVLFDFLVPDDPQKLRKSDLFQQVAIPRLGVF
jgi:hypothetical protein